MKHKILKNILAITLVFVLSIQFCGSALAKSESSDKKNFKETMTIGETRYTVEKVTDDITGNVKVIVIDDNGNETITNFAQVDGKTEATITEYKTDANGNKTKLETKVYKDSKIDVQAQASYNYNSYTYSKLGGYKYAMSTTKYNGYYYWKVGDKTSTKINVKETSDVLSFRNSVNSVNKSIIKAETAIGAAAVAVIVGLINAPETLTASAIIGLVIGAGGTVTSAYYFIDACFSCKDCKFYYSRI